MRPLPKSGQKRKRSWTKNDITSESDGSFDVSNDPNLIHSTRRSYENKKTLERIQPSDSGHDGSLTPQMNLTYSCSSESEDDIDIILDKRAKSMYRKKTSLRSSPRKKIQNRKTKKKLSFAKDNLVRSRPVTPQHAERRNLSNKKNLTSSANRRKQNQPQRYKSKVLKEIETQQNRIDNLIPKLPFSRVIREILMKHSYNNSFLRISLEALTALQEVSEMYLTQYFQDSNLCTIHGKRVTLMVKDMKLVSALRNHGNEKK